MKPEDGNVLLFLLVFLLAAVSILAVLLLRQTTKLKKIKRQIDRISETLKERISDLESEKTKITAIIENLDEGVLAVDDNRMITSMNSCGESILGTSRQSAAGKGLLEVVRDKVLDEMMEKVLAGDAGSPQETEVSFGSNKIIRASAVRIQHPNGDLSGILVLYDVTEVRKLENMRREFVANVSHELRTPLTSIKGFVETLLGGALNDRPQSEAFLKIMEEDANRLTRLIDDLLELSKIESKEIPLRLEQINLGELINQILIHFKKRLSEKQLTAENRLDKNAARSVLADRDKLKQVLLNLTDNAVKFNRDGGKIIFSASPTPGGQIKISVEDTGTGIPDKIIARVFERFFRADKARSKETAASGDSAGQGGTGLGLAIVKHIVEVHGGEVGCASQPGKGSVFWFTLPAG